MSNKSLCDICKLDAKTCTRNKEKVVFVTINLTSRCNRNCHYCYNEFNLKSDMSKEDIDMLFDKLNELWSGHALFTRFIGGEPSLVKDIIAYVAKRAVEDTGSFYSILNTNGDDTSITDIKANFEFVVSIHNINNFNYNWVDLQEKYRVSFVMVVTPNDLESILMEKLKYISSRGVKEVHLNFDITSEYSEEAVFNLYNFLEDFHSSELLQNIKIFVYDESLGQNRVIGISEDDIINSVFDYFPGGVVRLTHAAMNRPLCYIKELDRDKLKDAFQIIKDKDVCGECKVKPVCLLNKAIFITDDLDIKMDFNKCYLYYYFNDFMYTHFTKHYEVDV
jgi:molybdenum cofactor biosynthesis enzyme MoaA